MQGIFNPKSIAIIGASSRAGSIGNIVVQNLIDGKYPHAIYPINPTSDTILGLKAYKSVLDCPGEVDMAVYTVPEKLVLGCVQEACKKKVKGHVVITSGFSEVGNTAGELEIVKAVKESGGVLVGPNVVGVLLNGCNANASFAPFLPYKGKTALLSQSGALLIALDGVTFVRGFGCSSMISLGNMADVDFADSMNYYATDNETSCIALYIEGVKNGRRFIEAGRKAGKPIVALKSGVSAHGAAAAASHTGSLAGSVKVYDAAFNQAKVIRAMDLDELLDMSYALSMQPPMKGENIIVITNGGGIGVLSTDSAEAFGIPLKNAPKDLQEQFFKCMPSFGSPKNPVDITGGSGAKGYQDTVAIALKSDWVHGIAVLYCETAITKPDDIAEAVMAGIKEGGGLKKPVLCCFVGGELCVKAGLKLGLQSVPVYDNPRKTMCALSALRKYDQFRSRSPVLDTFTPFADCCSSKDKALAIIKAVRENGRSALTEHEARQVFAAYNIPVPKAKLARNPAEAVAIAKEFGYPVVMKIVSPQILHKSDAGGVKVNVKDDEGVKAAYEAIITSCKKYNEKADVHGILVAEMAPWGKEVIVGSVNDATFGPTVMFGMGGIFVEVLKDVTFRVAPFSPEAAREMLPEIKSYPILAGVRGETPKDTEALSVVVSRISQMVNDLAAEVKEVDANPVIVYDQGKGLNVVDARMILTTPNNAPPPSHH